MVEQEKIDLEWRSLVNLGATPSIRAVSAAAVLDSSLVLICGEGSGVGKTSQVWSFCLKESRWNLLNCTGDIPQGRDGHTATYIGDNKFLIFGGQGVSKPNGKSDRDGDRSKTLCMREVYNDIYQLDVSAKSWTRVNVDGSVFPAGRRGHSTVYITQCGVPATAPISSSKSVVSTGSVSQMSGGATSYAGSRSQVSTVSPSYHQQEPLVKSLLVFGGSGIEASRGTEQLYNDLWAYSRETNRWRRVFPRGTTPRAMFDHRAEIVGENMVIVGGILGPPKTNTLQKEVMFPNTIILLNLRQLVWNYVDINDIYGKPAKMNLYGHSLCLDTNNNLLIFGGNETVDSKRASLEIGHKSPSRTNTHIWSLNVYEGTVTPLDTKSLPENRIEHIGVSMRSANELLSQADAFLQGYSYSFGSNVMQGSQRIKAMNNNNSSSSITSNNGSNSNNSSVNNNNTPSTSPTNANGGNNTKSSKGRPGTSEPHQEPMMLVFGGSSADFGGYCDPIVYQLIRIRTVVEAVVLPSSGESGMEVDDPSMSEYEGSRKSQKRGKDNCSLSRMSIGSDWIDEDDDDGGGLVNRGPSIWEKMSTTGGGNEFNGHSGPRDPSNWDELKLALTYSKTQKSSIHNATNTRSTLGNSKSMKSLSSPKEMSMVKKSDKSLSRSRSVGLLLPSLSKSSSGVLGTQSRSAVTRNNSPVDAMMSSNASMSLSSSQPRLDLSDHFVPPDMAPSVFSKLSEKEKHVIKIKTLSRTLAPILKGKTKVEAKFEFLSEYPFDYDQQMQHSLHNQQQL